MASEFLISGFLNSLVIINMTKDIKNKLGEQLEEVRKENIDYLDLLIELLYNNGVSNI